LLKAHGARRLRDETGTLRDDAKVHLFEVYRDDAAFEVHCNGSSIARSREETAGELLRVNGNAQNQLARLDDKEPEHVEAFRTRSRPAD
jgi:hypothetical protein